MRGGRRQPVALSAEEAETGKLGRLFAPLEQPLHAEADAEQGPALADARENRLHPVGSQRPRGAEVSDARHDDSRSFTELGGVGGRVQVGAEGAKRLAHRRQVARAVVDERDHNRPLVLGSTFARRLSFEQATRSARANALKTAST